MRSLNDVTSGSSSRAWRYWNADAALTDDLHVLVNGDLGKVKGIWKTRRPSTHTFAAFARPVIPQRTHSSCHIRSRNTQQPPTANMDLSESQTTFPSDSENYDANYDANHSNSQDSEEQTSHSSSPLILYSPPTFLSILRGAAINLVLPFVNGLMLGFGELFAHEAAFRLGWSGTRVGLSKRSVSGRESPAVGWWSFD